MKLLLSYTTLGYVGCCCGELAAGQTVDLPINIENIPTIPESIRAIVTAVVPKDVDGVEGRTYTFEYEGDDLLGLITHLEPEEIDLPICVDAFTLSKEYVDETYGGLAEDVADAIAEARVVSLPSSIDHVSPEYSISYPSITVNPNTLQSQYVSLTDFFQDIPDTEYTDGSHFRIDIRVTVVNGQGVNELDSYAEALHTGSMANGCTTFVKNLVVAGEDTLSIARSGEDVGIAFDNVSTTEPKTLRVQATLQIFY